MNWLKGEDADLELDPLKKTLCRGAIMLKKGSEWYVYAFGLGFPITLTITTSASNKVIDIPFTDEGFVMVDPRENARTYPLNHLDGIFS